MGGHKILVAEIGGSQFYWRWLFVNLGPLPKKMPTPLFQWLSDHHLNIIILICFHLDPVYWYIILCKSKIWMITGNFIFFFFLSGLDPADPPYCITDDVTISDHTLTRHVVENILIGYNYTFRVRARLSNGTDTAWTNTVTATGLDPSKCFF